MIYIKKFFIIFSCMILLSLTLVSSVFASFPSSYLDNSNLLDESNIVNAVFDSQGLQPFYYVDLESDTTYTFVAPSGSDRFICSPVVDDYPGATYPCVFSYDSTNLYSSGIVTGSLANGSQRGVFIYRIYQNGTYYLDYDYFSSRSIVTDLIIWSGSNPYYYSLDVNTGTHGSKVFNIDYVPEGSYVQLNVTITNYSGSNINYDFTNIWFSNVPREADYTPGWAPTSYVDSYVQTYTFNTGVNGGGSYAVGIKDSMLENNDSIFTRVQSANSAFYLVEGELDFDSFYDYYYNTGYDAGFDSGFATGETSGLEASGMLRNLIFTVFSVPFVFIRNALDFEILGINFKNIVLVLLSASLVAWVIRTFKKGE